MHRFVSMKQSCGCARVRVRRGETLGHWRLRWHAVLVRGSRLRQRPSRAARRARLHQHRTKRADARCSTVDPGCGNANRHPEAPPPLWRLRLHNRTRLEVGHPQLSEELADSPIAAASLFIISGPARCNAGLIRRHASAAFSSRRCFEASIPSERVSGELNQLWNCVPQRSIARIAKTRSPTVKASERRPPSTSSAQ